MSDIRKSRQEEEFAELVEKAKDIPILQVIGSLEQVYDSRRHPLSKEDLASATYGNYLALCPFHPDENLGSFVITPSKNMWYCFTERLGTSGIHYEMRKFRDNILQEMFEAIAPALEDGSYLEICPDNWKDTMVVKDGMIKKNIVRLPQQEIATPEIPGIHPG